MSDKKKWNCMLDFSGSVEFEVKADNETSAQEKAEQLFESATSGIRMNGRVLPFEIDNVEATALERTFTFNCGSGPVKMSVVIKAESEDYARTMLAKALGGLEFTQEVSVDPDLAKVRVDVGFDADDLSTLNCMEEE
jgi:hypothetical protein